MRAWIASRWFPVAFALVQTVRHAGMVGFEYWEVTRSEARFDVREYVAEDLARPFFEAPGVCFYHHSTPVEAIDMPAVFAAGILHSIVIGVDACFDFVSMPRGQILTAAFVPFAWFVVGLSFRRMMQGRWRRQASNAIVGIVLSLGLFVGVIGMLFLIPGGVGLVVGKSDTGPVALGVAWWAAYIAALSAERLRVWPFAKIGP